MSTRGGADNLLLPCENRIVFEKLSKRLESNDTSVSEDKIFEFDDCKYLIQCTAAGQVLLSFALPEVDAHYQAQMLNQVALDTITSAFHGIAVLVAPEPGYQLTLELDTKTLMRLSKEQRVFWLKNLAAIRLVVIGNPLRWATLWAPCIWSASANSPPQHPT